MLLLGELWEILTLAVDCHVSEERTYNELGLWNKYLGSEWQAEQRETSQLRTGAGAGVF